MAFIANNTTKHLSVIVVGQYNQARFSLGPRQYVNVGLTPGLKALLAFSSQGLYAMRPIRATAPGQTFLVDPSGTSPDVIVRVYGSVEGDHVSIEEFNRTATEQIGETELIQPLYPEPITY